MRTESVLRVGDRHDARAAGESHRRFEADHAIGIGGAHNAAIGLRPKRHRREVRRDARGRSGTGAAGIAINAIGIVRLPAPARPPADGLEGAEVSPLRKVRFSQDYRAPVAQVFGNRGVNKGRLAEERERASGGLHLVAGVYIALKQHRDSMHWPEHDAVLAQHVGVVRYHQCVWVQLDHRVDPRTILIDRDDASNIFLGQFLRGECAGGHRRLELSNRPFVVRTWKVF